MLENDERLRGVTIGEHQQVNNNNINKNTSIFIALDGKVKRNHLNTPRYEYSDVYTHGDKTRSTQMDPSEWRCACVENKEGYNGL